MALIKAKQLDSTDNYNFNTVVLGQVTPTAPAQAASKAYVDSVAQGLDVKESVRVATTIDINLASAPATIDGVTLANGDRVLVKNQTNAEENGIYIFNGIGSAMTRSVDADENTEVTANLFTFVEEGTSLADTGWVLTTNNPIILGTDPLTFSQFSGAGTILAGEGLTKTGSVLDVNVDNSTIEISSDTLRVKDLGITTAKLANDAVTKDKINADVAGNGLGQNVDGSLEVNVDGATIVINADTLEVGTVPADQVSVTDAGDYFTGTNVEDILQEIGLELGSLGSNASITDLQAAVGSATGLAGLDYSSNNYVTDGTSLEAAVGALDAAIKANADNLQAHLDDTTDAHDASAISYINTTSGLTAINVQSAIDELDARIDTNETDISNLQSAVGTTGNAASLDYTEENYITDGDSLFTAVDKLDIALKVEEGARIAGDQSIRDDLASTTNGEGASLVGIQDAGGYFTSSTVEGALAELGLQLSGAGNIDSRLDNLEAVVGSTTGLADIDFTSNNVVTDGTSLEAAISALDAFLGSNVTTADFDKLAAITSTASEIDTAVASAHDRVYDSLPVSTNGQTAFTLSATPKANGIVELFINGQGQVNGTDYTVSGTSLTWTSGDFALATTDKVVAVYDTAA